MDKKCKGEINIDLLDNIKKELLKSNNTKNVIIKSEKVIIQYSTLEEQKDSENSEVSSIDLGTCEELLRHKYDISEEESLKIYKLDIKTDDLISTYVYYEVYDTTGTIQLDLDVCKDVDIVINSPVILEDSLDLLNDRLSESGYNLFNENDSFYHDICAVYTTENDTDMLLSDRKNYIYSSTKNQTMCQTGCELESYNSITKKAKCSCAINKEEITDLNVDNLFEKREIAKSFYNTLSNSNFRVLKCIQLVFSSQFKKNIGENMMTVIFILFTVLITINCIKGPEKIHYYINIILKNSILNKNSENINKNNQPDIKGNNETQTLGNNKKTKKMRKSIKKKRRNKKSIQSENIYTPPKKRNKKNSANIKIFRSEIDLTKKSEDITSNSNSNINMKKNTENYRKNNNNKIKSRKKSIINNTKISTDITRLKNMNKNSLKNRINNFNLNNLALNKIPNSKNSMIPSSKSEDKNALNEDFKNLNDQELNTLEYNLAIKYDKRTYLKYYWSLLKKKHLILFAFFPSNDYNIATIKISLFILSFALYFTINGFFFSDETMHKIYKDNGVFDILFQIPQILYSTVISALINMILKQLSLSENSILSIKEEKDSIKAVEKSKKIEKCLKIKFIIFFILSSLFMIFFWYFISCFCAVYTNTQIILIKDTLFSFGLSMIYPFGLNLIPGFFRFPALRAEKKDKQFLYKVSLIVALI